MNEYEKRLIRLYLKTETEIINEIVRLRSQGLADYHAVAALHRVQRLLFSMQTEAWEYAPMAIEAYFYARVPEARRMATTAAGAERAYLSAASLTSEQHEIVNRLTVSLMAELDEAGKSVMSGLDGYLVGRREPDLFRARGLTYAAELEAGGGRRRKVDQLVESIRQRGVTAFVDKAGRSWRLHTYATMVTRTATRQAEVLSVLTRDPEQDLFTIVGVDDACGVCAPYQGRVYSKSGRDNRFPPLADAFGKIDPAGPDELSNTWLNIHPNCRCSVVPWSAAGRSERELLDIQRFSSPATNPYSVDPRGKRAIEAYRKKEEGRRKWLADYRQWERYRATIPEAVPKSFATFQRHKLAGDEKYRLWSLDYRRRSELLRHPERALPGAATAVAREEKFTRYFFAPENSDGFAKGRAFSSRLGYNEKNWELMREEILSAAARYPAVFREKTLYGDKYSQTVILQGLKGTPANVILGWIAGPDGLTHLTTAHVEEI